LYFSDHLLGQWLLRGLSKNPSSRQFIPDRFLGSSSSKKARSAKNDPPESARANSASRSRRPSSGSARRPASGNAARKCVVESTQPVLQTDRVIVRSVLLSTHDCVESNTLVSAYRLQHRHLGIGMRISVRGEVPVTPVAHPMHEVSRSRRRRPHTPPPRSLRDSP
jgi:hypothetical protein